MKKHRVCVISEGEIWIKVDEKGNTELPILETLPNSIVVGNRQLEVIEDDENIYTAAIVDKELFDLRYGFELSQLRPLFNTMPSDMFKATCKASQVVYWDIHSRYCPVCGTQTEQFAFNAKRCPKCKFEIYPTISPASIVLVRRGDEILMVKAKNFRNNHYGLVAGFLETGESAEECVRREVREETGLEIENIKYFGSQAWPFPSGLMIAFTADYKSGNIKIQEEELVDAAFFTRDNLPNLPGEMSVARQLIEAWRKSF